VASIKFKPHRYIPKFRLGAKGSTRNESLVVQLMRKEAKEDLPLTKKEKHELPN